MARPPSFTRGENEPLTDGVPPLPLRSIEDSSGVPQVWQRRSEGSGTSHNAFSENFWGNGTIFWGRQSQPLTQSTDVSINRLAK